MFLHECRSAITAAFQHGLMQGDFETAAIEDMANAENGSEFEVEVEWVGFERRIRGRTYRRLETWLLNPLVGSA